ADQCRRDVLRPAHHGAEPGRGGWRPGERRADGRCRLLDGLRHGSHTRGGESRGRHADLAERRAPRARVLHTVGFAGLLAAHRRDGCVMRVAWLCEAPTWGPAMRALAVLGPGTDVEGVVLGQRSEVDNEVLIAERVPFVHVGCCGDDSMEHHLARTEADVLVADACWAPLAAADGRPYITLGMHGAGEWDLDSMPLHPWTWQALPRRVDVRALFDVPEDVPVVAIMSNATRVNVIENAVA